MILAGPSEASANIEKTFFNDDGKTTNAYPVRVSNFTSLDLEPKLLVYLEPCFNLSSKKLMFAFLAWCRSKKGTFLIFIKGFVTVTSLINVFLYWPIAL